MARQSAADKVRNKTFQMVFRGYDREAVDAWKDQTARLIDELEQLAPRDAVVKRALEEVGQETADILQRAHEAADELTARSRSQAEGRLRRAEGEAEITVKDAQQEVERLEADTRALWDERTRLLEEMRQLADEVLGVADDALDRMAPPGQGDAGQTTDEVAVQAEDGAQPPPIGAVEDPSQGNGAEAPTAVAPAAEPDPAKRPPS